MLFTYAAFRSHVQSYGLSSGTTFSFVSRKDANQSAAYVTHITDWAGEIVWVGPQQFEIL